MPLIRVAEHAAADLAAWEEWERGDALHAQTTRFRRLPARALDTVRDFVRERGAVYCSVSWGKDSIVCAHLVHALADDGLRIPCAWVRVRGRENPHCVLVRDAFLARWPVDYHEIEVEPGPDGATSSLGFAAAARRWPAGRITGIRGSESGVRARRCAAGAVVGDSCAPLAHWSLADVFAYAWAHDLPVHPAYGLSMGGALPRDAIRVGALGGQRGAGMGRAEWEARYYLPPR